MLTLHNYFRSSTSTRLRAALNLKGLDYDYKAYALLKKETQTPDFLARSPAGLVPVLELDDGTALSQSLAIIEYLEEEYPDPPLLPADARGRARVRALAYMIACEVHPLNNLRVLQYLATQFDQDDQGKAAWFNHWVHQTFRPLEALLADSPETGRYCHGDTPGLADCCLYAQIWNNRRFKVDSSPYPTIERIFAALDELEPFRKAAPPEQPDAT
ncbi:maleylacetoacetate isomerase [Psychromarinibacter sp. C21-152]|uniref:Maleylacetoacetate isomerase n=1 Tax=Psychromarinibacter sediminicola TaxID=3033385 RepID=A0AAE3NQ08_9RHOB|nr:maleylacetoacetate isomerase [Psychromarinibacter sediminicola]MDF0599896.1 maleylacetoacetate isomerase [Psychromarinibacter sediminicola]